MPDHFKCVVTGCNSHTRDNIAMFGFPSEPGRVALWSNKLNLAAGTNLKKSRVCVAHFNPSDIKWIPRLSVDAIPLGTVTVEAELPVQPLPQTPTLAEVEENVTPANFISPENVEAFQQDMQRRLSDQREKINSANQEKYSLKRKVISMRQRMNTGPKTLTKELLEEYFTGSKALCDIIIMQYERYGNKCNAHYSNLEKSLAITLFYSCGKNGYRTLKNLGVRLPHIGTLKRWISKLKFTPGRCPQLVDALQDLMTRMNDFEKDCVLMFDETQIHPLVTYNRFDDRLEGVVLKQVNVKKGHEGSGETQMKKATQSLVIMLRGLNTNFKFPLSFHFSSGNMKTEDLKNLILDTLTDCFGAGANVVAVVSDQAPWNRKVFEDFGVGIDNNSFMHEGHEIFCFYDAPHLLKNVRNNLMDLGFLSPYGTGKEMINWKLMKNFYDADRIGSTRLCPKLTDDHMDARNALRMRVSLATQVLSSSVAAGIETMVRFNVFPAESKNIMLALATFCRNFDFIFDYMNIGIEVDHKKQHKSAKYLTSRFDHIRELADWVSGITKQDGNMGRIACLPGVQMNLRGLIRFVQRRIGEGYKFVLTRRLQSDCLENFFGMIKIVKGLGKHPTCQQFRLAFRYLFCTNMIKGPMGANCEQDFEPDEILDEVIQKIDFLLNWKNTEKEETDDESEDEDEFESSGDDSNDDDRTSYAVNKFFTSFGELLSTPATLNGAVYLGDRVVKAIVAKTKCIECKGMLEFLSDRHSSQPTLEEYFHSVKASATLEGETELGFSHLLTKRCREMFIEVDKAFPDVCKNAFNMFGTGIVSNIVRGLLRNTKIKEWQIMCSSGCEEHRKMMLSRFVRTRMYCLVKMKNDDAKFRPVVEYTAEELEFFESNPYQYA